MARPSSEQSNLSSFLDRLITPSDYVRRRLVNQGVKPEKITVIHNGVYLERFQQNITPDGVRERYGIGPKTFVVVSISQLILLEAPELPRPQIKY
jgi:glycosyltransferase involved in cell wall biosynthesis